MGSVNTPKVLEVRLVSTISTSPWSPKTYTVTGMMGKQREEKFSVQVSPGYNNICPVLHENSDSLTYGKFCCLLTTEHVLDFIDSL